MTTITILFADQSSAQNLVMKKPLNGVYVIAHRGAHNGIPENSLPAYKKAIDIGCDFVEIDVRTTKDGKFVSMHNAKIDKYVPGKKGKVNDYTLKQLRAFDIGKSTGSEWKGTKIPTLEEILELCKGKIGIYLDLKKAPVPELVKVIKKSGMEKDIIWYIPASEAKHISDLRRTCPECLLMPDPGNESNITAVADTLHPGLIATDMNNLSESFVRSAHSRQIKVIADDREAVETEWKKMIDWKTDGIQTDKPEELIRFLNSKH